MSRWKLFRIGVVVVLIIAAVLLGVNCKNKTRTGRQRELVVASYGGAYQDAQRKAFFEPFAKRYNVTIREENHSGDLAKIKAMVESGSVIWDVIDVESNMVLRGARQNLYEKIDYLLIPQTELLPEAIHEYGVATCFWSTVMAYNTKHFPESRIHPKNWVEFWDSSKFPGPRSLRKSPISTLEFALLADGVEKSNLYPLDVDRAFKSLDRIKNDVSVWWEAGEQPAQLLASGEVILASAWNGRIYNARKAGKPVQEIWEDGLIDADWWVIPRGSKNRDLAMKFIAFASEARPQAEFTKYIPYGPVNKKAIDEIPQYILTDLPTSPDNVKKQVFLNSKWWDENLDMVQERWQKWLLK
jgi:putative spermidine/putrescine transport system substrate-binding protein